MVFYTIHRGVCTLQLIVEKYHGTLHKFNMNDRETCALIGFGLEPLKLDKHHASRAVLAALDIASIFKQQYPFHIRLQSILVFGYMNKIKQLYSELVIPNGIIQIIL